jgi:hypothetical protein
MGLLMMIFEAPLLPVRGAIALGELIKEQVDHELSSPAAIRTEMEELERQRAAGLISDADLGEAEQRAIDRLIGR